MDREQLLEAIEFLKHNLTVESALIDVCKCYQAEIERLKESIKLHEDHIEKLKERVMKEQKERIKKYGS